MAIDKSNVGVAGEFAVAAELCRCDVYAQLTLGNRKRTDLLVVGKRDRMHRIEVKAKQKKNWPHCRGIPPGDSFLVFVDFAGKSDTERPDFYVLTARDWRKLVDAHVVNYKAKHPARRIKIHADNYVVLLDQKNKKGQPHRGMSLSQDKIQVYREKWSKITGVAHESKDK